MSSISHTERSAAGHGPSFVVTAEPRHRLHSAMEDLAEGLRRWELWVTMGLQDVKRHYRRSVLGPIWLTLSLAILVAALGYLYSGLMGVSLHIYVPHLALGFLAWQFISGVLGDSCNVFIKNKGWLINVRTPLSLFVYQLVWQHLITMGHNALVYLGVAVIFGIFAGWAGLLIIPVMAILIVNAIWVALLFGTLCARFRDIPQIVQSLLRIGFFVTPVMWMPGQLGDRAYLAYFNPFTYFVELVRAPLLGEVPPVETWALALAVTVIGWTLAAFFFTRFRGRVPYWV